jgi:hypothetical protein
MRKSYLYFLLGMSAASFTFAAGADDELLNATARFTSAMSEGRIEDARGALEIIQIFAQGEDERANSWLIANSEQVFGLDSMPTADQQRPPTRRTPPGSAQAGARGGDPLADLQQRMITGVNYNAIHDAFDALKTMRILAVEK